MPRALADRLAPEHLEIATADPESLSPKVRHAGAIFLGRHTPEAMGDYIAGPNHVLPTSRSARFSSGLSVLDFMKRTTLLELDANAIAALGPEAMTLAEAEGLEAHARSIAARLNRKRLIRGSSASATIPRRTKRGAAQPAIDQEREVAISDLLEANLFKPKGSAGGPYRLTLSVEGEPAGLDIAREERHATHQRVRCILLSLAPFRTHRQGLFPGLRQLLQGDPHRAAITRSSPWIWARRAVHDEGTRTSDQAPGRQDRNRFRHRAAAVHADLRAASAGLTMEEDQSKPRSVLFVCTMNAVRSPMAAAIAAPSQGPRALCGIGRRACGRAGSPGRRGDGGAGHRARATIIRKASRISSGQDFDLVVTLSPGSRAACLD